MINLDRWVSEGVEPPPSEFPRLAEGTAVTREALLAQFDAFPDISLLDPDQLPRLRRLDLGPDTDRGIARLPAQTGEPYPSFVDGKVHVVDRMVDTAPYAAYGSYVDGCLSRLSTAALLNVTAGGGSQTPTFVVEKRG